MGEAGEPGTRSLFEAIKGFVQFAHVAKKGKIHKPLGLFHVNLFIEETVKKGIGDVQLLEFLVKLDG
jgi:hypothetical protein